MRLDDLPLELKSVETAERWQKVLNILNAGEMPPQGLKQPPAAEKVAFLDTLSNTMVSARKLLGDTGGAITMRRLNRREYVNTIRDLLGVTPDAAELPSDASPGTFDTVGSSLFFSGDQFEQYLTLARAALDEAIVVGQRPETTTKHIEVETDATAQVQKRLDKWLEGYQRAMKWEAAKGKKSVRDFGFDDELDAGTMLEVIRAYGPNHARYLADPLTRQGAYLTGYYPARLRVHHDSQGRAVGEVYAAAENCPRQQCHSGGTQLHGNGTSDLRTRILSARHVSDHRHDGKAADTGDSGDRAAAGASAEHGGELRHG